MLSEHIAAKQEGPFCGETWEELLESVGLTRPAPDHSPVLRSRTRSGGLQVRIVEFELPCASVQAWIEESLGPGTDLPRAWVTSCAVKDVLGVDDIPDHWRLDNSKQPGSPRERYIMVDDGDPARVTVGISATYGPWGGQRS